MVRLLAIALALSLAACLPEAKLQADSEAAFTASLEAATNRMSPVNKERVDAALRDLVLARLGPDAPQAAADKLASNWAAARAALVVKHARDVVHGRTVREIIVIAEEERKKSTETALAAYREQLAKAKAALKDIESAAEPAPQAEQQALLQQIEIAKARFGFEELGMLEQPTISFSVANKSSVPVKRIFVHGRVQTPGRAAPWIDTDLDHAFPGGLKPGETRELNLTPNMFSEWGTVPREAMKGAALSLELVAFEDAAEKRYGVLTPDRLRRRKSALEEGIRTLEDKVQALEKQAKGG
jgi:hypothetical protein